MESRRRLCLVLGAPLVLFCAACGGGGGAAGGLQVTNAPTTPVGAEASTLWSYQLDVQGADAAPSFRRVQGPTGLTVDAGGRLSWTPPLDDLGTSSVEIEVSDSDQSVVVDIDVRVHQGLLLGTGYSPRGHDQGVAVQDGVDYFTSTTHGKLVGFHTNWRDAGTTNGEIPGLVVTAMAARDQFGVQPTLVIGWANGDGVADLTSDSEPGNNTWTNAETRQEFLDMVTALASTYQPRYLALANEFNIWWATHGSEYDDWESLYQSAYDAIKLASPETQVYVTFQLEFLKGDSPIWPHGDTWAAFDAMVTGGPLDAAVFTTYPYFEFSSPVAIPSGYYDEITTHWGAGPVSFTEIGWLSAPNFPYPGDPSDQALFISTFFNRTRNLDLERVQWLFLHDVDNQVLFPPFVGVGLRNNDASVIRPADGAWQAAVSLRER